MTLVRELADGLNLIAEVVQNTQSLVKAIRDGHEYLRREHPEAEREWAALIREMQLTVEGLAQVTKVMSSFTFVAGPAAAQEPVRFNNYVIDQKGHVAALKGRLRELKGSSGKVRAVRDSLDARGRTKGWGSMFGMLGQQGRRDAQHLAGVLSNFYADDERLVEAVTSMLRLADRAVKDVQKALAPGGVASPAYIGEAAAVIQVYAAVFARPERELDPSRRVVGGGIRRIDVSLDGRFPWRTLYEGTSPCCQARRW